MGTAPGGSTLPGGSTWGPAAGSRQKNIYPRWAGSIGGARAAAGRAGGLPWSHVGQNCPEGLPHGAAGLRGWGRPGRAFNLNLREASRRRAAPGRAGIWAPAAPPVVQSRRRRQLLDRVRGFSRMCAPGERSPATLGGRAWAFFLISLLGTLVGV